MMAFLLPMVFVAALSVILIWGLLILASRYVHRFLAATLGGVVIMYLLQNMVRGMLFCAAEPQYIPPSGNNETDGGVGQMIHNCDGPGGVLDYVYLYFLAPLMIAVIGVLTLRYSRRGGAVT